LRAALAGLWPRAGPGIVIVLHALRRPAIRQAIACVDKYYFNYFFNSPILKDQIETLIFPLITKDKT
jgi:hypothetical protein